MKHSQADIDLALENIAEGEQHIAAQKVKIERQRNAGEPTKASKRVLKLIEAAVKLMKKNLATIRAENKFEK